MFWLHKNCPAASVLLISRWDHTYPCCESFASTSYSSCWTFLWISACFSVLTERNIPLSFHFHNFFLQIILLSGRYWRGWWASWMELWLKISFESLFYWKLWLLISFERYWEELVIKTNLIQYQDKNRWLQKNIKSVENKPTYISPFWLKLKTKD